MEERGPKRFLSFGVIPVRVVYRDESALYQLNKQEPWIHLQQSVLIQKFMLKQYEAYYTDDEGDKVCISSDMELKEAVDISVKANKFLELFVKEKSDQINLLNEKQTSETKVEMPVTQQPSSGAVGVLNTVTNQSNSDHLRYYSVMESLRTGTGLAANHLSNNDCVVSKRDVTSRTCHTREDFREKNEGKPGSTDVVAMTTERAPAWFTSYMQNYKKECDKHLAKQMRLYHRQFMPGKKTWGINTNYEEHNDRSATITGDNQLNQQTGNHAEHPHVVCDSCNKAVKGIRYKCGHCVDFDLCENCEAAGNRHDPDHVFLKVVRPLATNYNMLDETTRANLLAALAVPGRLPLLPCPFLYRATAPVPPVVPQPNLVTEQKPTTKEGVDAPEVEPREGSPASDADGVRPKGGRDAQPGGSVLELRSIVKQMNEEAKAERCAQMCAIVEPCVFVPTCRFGKLPIW